MVLLKRKHKLKEVPVKDMVGSPSQKMAKYNSNFPSTETPVDIRIYRKNNQLVNVNRYLIVYI